jgi:hypothetical protein
MDERMGFLKRHGFVIAAVALPILLVVAVAVARLVPRLLVEDPRYDLVYSAVTEYSSAPSHRHCVITAVDGRVRVRWTQSEQEVYGATQRVYRLSPASGEVREIPVPEAGDLRAPGDTQDLTLGGLEDVRIDTSPRAPDGYEYEFSYASGGGLFGDLFYRGSRGPRSTIEKQGRVIVLPRANQGPYGYDSVTFLGWAIPIDRER